LNSINEHLYYYFEYALGIVMNVALMINLVIWMTATICVSVWIEMMGCATPSWVQNIFDSLKRSERYTSKINKKKFKYKGCRKCMLELSIMYASSMNTTIVYATEVTNNSLDLSRPSRVTMESTKACQDHEHRS
jgi:hypothetical protein